MCMKHRPLFVDEVSPLVDIFILFAVESCIICLLNKKIYNSTQNNYVIHLIQNYI